MRAVDNVNCKLEVSVARTTRYGRLEKLSFFDVDG
jgi:hypothetical protein